MKRIIIFLSLLLLVGCQSPAQEDSGAVVSNANSVTDTEDSTSQEAFQVQLDGDELLSGNALTNDYFKQKPYTLVNVWGTFCPPCIQELPELNELHKMDHDVQVLGIIADASSDSDAVLEAAKSLVNSNQIEYLNLVPSPEFYERTLTSIQGLPTSFIVDQDGKVVSQLFVGAGSVDEYLEFIDHTMENLK